MNSLLPTTRRQREIFNTVSHLLGTMLAVAALVALVTSGIQSGNTRKIVAFSVYGGSLVFLYMSSTLYHWLWGRAKAFFKRMDYIGIFMLIAGTYTPFALLTIGGTWGWGVLAVIWSVALFGGVVYAIRGDRAKKLAFVLYIAMGWIGLVTAGPMSRNLPPAALTLLVGGGLLYTVGVALLGFKSVKRSHEIWHVLVLSASACHFLVMFIYVA